MNNSQEKPEADVSPSTPPATPPEASGSDLERAAIQELLNNKKQMDSSGENQAIPPAGREPKKFVWHKREVGDC